MGTSATTIDERWFSPLPSTGTHCLLIKHSDGWRDDRCERWLHQHGFTSETHISQNGKSFPDVNRFTHVIVYGGIPCVKDAAHMECLQREMKFLDTVLSSNTPCIGICLGAQLIAHVLGARVNPLPCRSIEFGFSLITPTEEGNDFMPQPCNMLQWHCEGFELPKDCTLLATGSVFPNQAFRYGDCTYGVQFHPEVTADVLKIWHHRYIESPEYKTHPTVKREQCVQQLWDCHRYSAENTRWFNQFMQQWTTL